MGDNTRVLTNLVTSLDDVRLLCAEASDRSARPWLKRALSELVQFHQRIADELCVQIKAASGARIARLGRRRQDWRDAWSRRLALRAHRDSDLASLQQAKRREERLTRAFTRATRCIPGGDTHWRLERALYEVDHARMKLTLFAADVESDLARSVGRRGSVRVTTPATASQPAMRGRTDVKA
ncbi:MAG: hypothetical protein ACREPF_03010 [Rhodanobacteraceae bacterium]